MFNSCLYSNIFRLPSFEITVPIRKCDNLVQNVACNSSGETICINRYACMNAKTIYVCIFAAGR